jgi:integrase/recombinase XerD
VTEKALPPGSLDPEGMGALISDYLEALRVLNYSTHTVRMREHYLQRFAGWCADRSLTRPSEITKPMLERYQRWLFHYRNPKGRPISFRSQAHAITAVRGFFRHLSRHNIVLTNPAADLDLPKEEKRLPLMILSVSEVEQVLQQPNVHDLLGLRDRAILETLYSTGIRRGELVRLSVYDVDPQRETVFVRQGKGKKDRYVPIGERALAWVQKYLHEVRPKLIVEPDPANLFLTMQGTAIALASLTDAVRNYVVQSGIGKAGACHLFRHTMATLMLEGGADIRYIQEMLGHARLETTQIYTRVAIHKLKAIHNATHPGARLKGPAPREASPLAAEPSHEPRAELLSTLDVEDDDGEDE